VPHIRPQPLFKLQLLKLAFEGMFIQSGDYNDTDTLGVVIDVGNGADIGSDS